MDIYWIWLSTLKGLGSVTQKILLDKFKDPYVIYNTPRSDIISIKGIGGHIVDLIETGKNLEHAKKVLNKVKQDGSKLRSFLPTQRPPGAMSSSYRVNILQFKIKSIKTVYPHK